MKRSEPDQPVSIPTVVLTVHEDGILTATLDGAPLTPPQWAPPWRRESFPQIIDQTTADTISSASSEVSDLDDDREETPDLYRNSALGMLDPARQDDSDTSEDEDDDEMDYDQYDDEMEYDDEMAPVINDGEVVSDEELDDAIDGAGPMEGLPATHTCTKERD